MGTPTKTICEPEASRHSGAAGNDPGSSTLLGGLTPFRQSSIGNLALQYSSVDEQNSSSFNQWSFDPNAENVSLFTNRDLVDAILSTDDWLAKNTYVHLDYDAYIVRQKRLESETQARIDMGHLWLKTVHNRQSNRLYQTVEGQNNAVDVISVENDELVHGPARDISDRPIMTQGQFQSSISGQGVPTMNLQEYQAQLAASQLGLGGSKEQMPDVDYSFADAGSRFYGLSGGVSQSSARGNLLQDPFSMRNPLARQGAIGEVFFGTSSKAGYGFGARDYNAIPWTHPTRGMQLGNFPAVDYRTLFGAMPESSVKTTTVNSADPFRRYNTYLRGFAEMMNTEPNYRGFDHYMRNAAGGRTAAAVRGELSLIVNADDVAAFRQFVSNPFARETTPSGNPSRDFNYQRAALMRVYDGILQDRPMVLPDGTSLNTVAMLDLALGNNTITTTQHRATLLGISQQAATKINPNPDLTRSTLATFANARRAVPNAMSVRDVRSAVTPEYMHSLSHGGGWGGDVHAMRSYGGKGALLGLAFGMGREGMDMLTDEQGNPDAFERLLRAGGQEGVRGGATSSLEALAASRTSRYILQRGLVASSGRALAARFGSRFVPGGLVDVGLEGYNIHTEDRPHRPAEVGYRLGRAFVIGGTSALAGIYAGATIGASVGSVVPGLGTAVGFLVGVIVGAIVGFIMSAIIPNYEEMVMKQVPLKEFEKNIQAQTAGSIQNQILAEQELELLNALVHGPESRGPHNMREVFMRRNLSTLPGDRMFAEELIKDQIHGGCMECHMRTAGSVMNAQFEPGSEAFLPPVERMYLAAMEEYGNTGKRPKFLDWQVPGQTVPEYIAKDMAYDPTAAIIMNSINVIQPNLQEWRGIIGADARTMVPSSVMNSPMTEEEVKQFVQNRIDLRQTYYELFFGEVGEDEYKLYNDNVKKAEEAEKNKSK